MTSPRDERDLFMLCSLTPKKNVKVSNCDFVQERVYTLLAHLGKHVNSTAFTCASLSCSPVAPLFPARSLPARST